VDGYVTNDSGTGVVHQAPAYGEDDYRWNPSTSNPTDPLLHTLNPDSWSLTFKCFTPTSEPLFQDPVPKTLNPYPQTLNLY